MAKKISVIMPVYNERDSVARTVALVRAVDLEKEIIAVDDGSTDGTGEVLDQLAGPDLKVIHREKNAGKGAAIRLAIEHATGDIVIVQDADTEYDPQDYHRLVAPIREGRAEVVYGSRFRGSIEGMRFPNRMINKLLTCMANLLFRAGITDEATCYKVFRTEVLREIPLRCERFEFCPEVTAKVSKRHLRLVEVPISYRARTYAQGKKVNWRDGFEAIWTLLKYRFKD